MLERFWQQQEEATVPEPVWEKVDFQSTENILGATVWYVWARPYLMQPQHGIGIVTDVKTVNGETFFLVEPTEDSPAKLTKWRSQNDIGYVWKIENAD